MKLRTLNQARFLPRLQRKAHLSQNKESDFVHTIGEITEHKKKHSCSHLHHNTCDQSALPPSKKISTFLLQREDPIQNRMQIHRKLQIYTQSHWFLQEPENECHKKKYILYDV